MASIKPDAKSFPRKGKAEWASSKYGKASATVIENQPVGVAVAGKDGKYWLLNPEFTRITGYTLADIPTEKDWFEKAYPDPDYREMVLRKWEDNIRRGGKRTNAEFAVTCKDGRQKDIEFIVTCIEECRIVVLHDVSDRRKAENLLKESAERYKILIDNSTFGVYLIQDNLFKYMNEACARIHGCTPDECIDTRGPMDLVAPADRKLMAENIEKQMSGEVASSHFRCRILRTDGMMRRVEVFGCRSMYNGRPAVLGTMTDITEHLQAQGLLNDQFQFLQKLIDCIPTPIFYKDRKGVYRGCNNAFAAALGVSREETVGRTIDQFHPKELADKYHEKDEELYANPGVQIYETTRRFPDGTIHNVIYNKATYTDAEGNIEGLIGVIFDITDRKRMEELLERMSITDELTGLYNRRGFFLLAQQQLQLAERTKEAMLLVFVDFDGMKWINDTCGHQEGDSVLIETAAVLKRSFRKSDIIGRIGGDEFAALAVHSRGATQNVLITRLKHALDLHNASTDRPYKFSLSAGIAHYDPQKPCSLDELIAEADKRMYREKTGKQGE